MLKIYIAMTKHFNMKYFISYLSAILLFAGFTGCSSDNDPDPGDYIPVPPAKSTQNTVLVYMAFHNNFSYEAPVKIKTLRENWSKNYDGNLLVYADEGPKAYLIHIYADQYNNNQADTIRKYGSENSASPEVFGRVMEEVFGDGSEWAAGNKGLIAISHATGWLSEGMLNSPRSGSRSVLHDRDGELEVWEFEKAIPQKLDYIMFDACLMAGVEVAYELKDKAKYLILSPAEVLAESVFIYPTIMSRLMKSTPDLEGVAKDFYNFFAKRSSYPYVTVSLIDTDGMDELAAVSKVLLEHTERFPSAAQDFPELNTLQQYYPKYPLYFDFGHYMETLSYDDDYTATFKERLENCIVYTAHTEYYYSSASGYAGKHYINSNHYSGMTTYIPQSRFPIMNQEYQAKLKWSKYIWGS